MCFDSAVGTHGSVLEMERMVFEGEAVLGAPTVSRSWLALLLRGGLTTFLPKKGSCRADQ